jgi:hypothetical protein
VRSRIFFTVAMVSAAATLIGSPLAKGQQRRTASIANFRANYGAHLGSPVHSVNRSSSLDHRRHHAFHEPRRVRVAGPFCIDTELAPTELLQEFPNDGLDFEYPNAMEDLGCAIGEPLAYLEARGEDIDSDEESQQSEATREPETEPQIVILEPSPSSGAEPTKLAQTPEPEPPLPDEGQFVLVLRDGSRLEAAAFSRSEGLLVYITAEGTRHVIPLSALDLRATLRVNDERGTPLQLSF